LLVVLVQIFPHSSLDLHISKEVQEEVNEQRDIDLSRPLTYVSIFGNSRVSAICVLVISLIFLISNNRRESLFVLFVFVADTLNLLLKNGDQPAPADPGCHSCGGKIYSFEFPQRACGPLCSLFWVPVSRHSS